MTMSASFVSTQYLASSLVLPVQQAQAQLATATTEESTGQYADLGLQLGDQSGYELSLREQVQQLQTLTAGNSVVATNLSTAQDALSSISSSAQTTAQDLATWTASANSGAELQTMGQTALQELTSSANATSGDVYVFGGINSSTAPLADYFSSPTSAAKTAVDQAFQTAFGCLPTDAAAANITASQMQSFLEGPFAALFSGSNWTTDWSSASSTNTSAEIAPGETVTTSTNANTPAFQSLSEAYTMLAAFGGSQLSSSAQQAVASAATSLITQGENALTDTQATLGVTQSQVSDANSAMSAQLTLIQQQVDGLDDVDQNATWAKITALTDQIQMAYELTARLQQLNLAQYLPVP
jgi:flagellar hook-associated protein 3 FlgL